MRVGEVLVGEEFRLTDNKEAIAFFTKRYILSNHSEGWPFTLNGVVCRTSEHAYMALRAISAGENKLAAKILEMNSPGEACRAGRAVKVSSEWHIRKRKLMKDINRAKFSQNPTIRAALLATGSKILVETSDHPYWASGWKMGDKRNEDSTKWKGMNWLGKVLEEIREEFRGEK